MKAILISDKPKWCRLMMNGDKTLEVRISKALAKAIQKLIDENGYADIYDYCTLGSPYLAKPKESEKYLLFTKSAIKLIKEQPLNGKVLFKFRCYKVEKITPQMFTPIIEHEILKKSCLKECELFDYVCSHDGTEDRPFYAIHISNLEIFDKPKELYEFETTKQHLVGVIGQTQPILQNIRLTKAPQNFCYIETEG